jgi:sortase A
MQRYRYRLLGAATVMIVPALLAFFLTRSEASDQRPPRVTRVLDAVSDASRSQADREPAPAPDSPVAGSLQGGKSLAIDFDRSRRVSLGRMTIPSIGVDTGFYEGVVDEAVELGPGHWPGTPWPGELGNSVFAGHRTTYTRPFADLDLVKPGARINVRMRNGGLTTYRVFKTSVLPEAEYAAFVLRQPVAKNVRMITVFACTPKGSRSHRIVVQARATWPVQSPVPESEEGAMSPS